jgi:hypothetical protein
MAKKAKHRVAASTLVVALSQACNERVPDDEPCYPPLSEVELVEGVTSLRCLDYEGDRPPGWILPQFDDLPDGVETEEFIYCFDLAPGQVCDGCSLEDTEELMRAAYLETKECELPVTDNVGECSHLYRTDDGYYAECCTAADCEQIIYEYVPGCAGIGEETGRCCYTAAIASPCTGRIIQ